MKKIIVSEWTSLDGVFDAGSMEQWFNPYHSDSRADYIREGILACDSMLYGRATYEMLYPYWSALKNNEMGVAGKLNSVKKYVVSTTMKTAPWEHSTIIDRDVTGEIARLKEASGGELLVTGSATLVNALLKARLVDEVRLLVHPYIVGAGKRLFQDGMNGVLELIESRTFDKGVQLLRYRTVL